MGSNQQFEDEFYNLEPLFEIEILNCPSDAYDVHRPLSTIDPITSIPQGVNYMGSTSDPSGVVVPPQGMIVEHMGDLSFAPYIVLDLPDQIPTVGQMDISSFETPHVVVPSSSPPVEYMINDSFEPSTGLASPVQPQGIDHMGSTTDPSGAVVPPQGMIVGHMSDPSFAPFIVLELVDQIPTMGQMDTSSSETPHVVVPMTSPLVEHMIDNSSKPSISLVSPAQPQGKNHFGSTSDPSGAVVPPQGMTMGHMSDTSFAPSIVLQLPDQISIVGQMDTSSFETPHIVPITSLPVEHMIDDSPEPCTSLASPAHITIVGHTSTPSSEQPTTADPNNVVPWGLGQSSNSSEQPSTMVSSPQGQTMKRKRKHTLKQSIVLALPAVAPLPSSFTLPNSSKKGKDNPRHSTNKNRSNCFRIEGKGFTRHVINVIPGEDIVSRMIALTQGGAINVSILSASGTLSNATLRLPAVAGGIVTYEGRYDIISLSGSFVVTGSNNELRRGGMSVQLRGANGNIFGGAVAGLLIAATPIQLLVASFNSKSPMKSKSSENAVPKSKS